MINRTKKVAITSFHLAMFSIVALGAFIAVADPMRSNVSARELSEEELRALIGDSTGKCVKSLPCTTFLVSGTSCCKCISNPSVNRTTCCESADGNCDYTATDSDCNVSKRECFDEIVGVAGSCGTCSPAGKQSESKACSLKNADGKKCP
jgi:hypothetical protein